MLDAADAGTREELRHRAGRATSFRVLGLGVLVWWLLAGATGCPVSHDGPRTPERENGPPLSMPAAHRGSSREAGGVLRTIISWPDGNGSVKGYTAHGDNLYLVKDTYSERVECWSLATGELRWARDFGERYIHLVTAGPEGLYASVHGEVCPLDPEGQILWRYAVDPHGMPSACAVSPSHVAFSMYVFDSAYRREFQEKLYCLDLHGREKWVVNLEGRNPGGGGPAPVFHGNTLIYAGSGSAWHGEGGEHGVHYPARVCAYELATGRPLWAKELALSFNQFDYPVISDGKVILAGGQDAYALDATSGRTLWHFGLRHDKGFSGPPAVSGQRAFFGVYKFGARDKEGEVIAVDIRDGQFMWRTRLESGVDEFTSPLAWKGQVFVVINVNSQASANSLIVLDERTGNIEAAMHTCHRLTESPIASNAGVLVVCTEGDVLCWKAAGEEGGADHGDNSRAAR